MELVYLWVEDYKNIKKQGFNFSPRFDCTFKDEYEKYVDTDGKEKERLKDNCELIIDKNENHVSIFPENINVTTIVGENGSGKTSLLESLIDLFSESSLSWLDDEKYKKYVVIYKYDNSYIYLQKHIETEIRIIDKNGNEIEWLKRNPNQRLFEWHSELLGLIIQNEVSKKRSFQEYKQIFIEQAQSFDKNRIKKQIIINSIIDSMFKKESNKFFSLKEISISIKWNNLFNEKEDGAKYDVDVLSEIERKRDIARQNFNDKKYKDLFYNIMDICDTKIKKLKKSEFLKVNHYQNDPYMVNYFNSEKQYNCQSSIEDGLHIRDLYKFIIEKLDNFEDLTIKVKQLNSTLLDFIFDLPEFIFDIELKDEDKSFQDLSFGERQLLTQLNFIQFYANKKQYIQYDGIDFFEDDNGNEHEKDIVYDKKVKSMIVLLDEFEIGLHPNWQKKAINYIVDFLKAIKNIDFNLIITSHSPFLLSDLPKENVIFLEKDEKTGNCINATNKVDINPFGANIHTLLSHGFFMKDGLMGEFAKSKINEVINFLNNNESTIKTNEEAQNLINIIGEPVIKKQLQKMLDSKRLSKIDEIDLIKNQMQELSNRLKEIENAED